MDDWVPAMFIAGVVIVICAITTACTWYNVSVTHAMQDAIAHGADPIAVACAYDTSNTEANGIICMKAVHGQ